MTALGDAIRRARMAKTLTLRQLEEITGIHNAHLSQIETGQIQRPSGVILWQLAQALDLDYVELGELAGNLRPTTGGGGRHGIPGLAAFGLEDVTPDELEELQRFLDAHRRAQQENDGGSTN